eukprot:gene40463-54723_t
MHTYGGLPAPLAVAAVLGLAAFLASYYAAAVALFCRYAPIHRGGSALFFGALWLLAGLDRIVALGFPVLLGASRKRFIGALDGGADADARLGGSIAAALSGADAGVAAVRVHDVRETVQALKVRAAINQAALTPCSRSANLAQGVRTPSQASSSA